MLLGTHAFLAIGNQLGVRWSHGARTSDIDLGHAGKNIAIALPATARVDVHGALQSLEMGFLPIEALGAGKEGTYVNPNNPELRVDFLTTYGRAGDDAVLLENLNVPFQPLKFLDFVLEAPEPAAVFSREGSVLVNVPEGVRYALHKLMVAGLRGQAFRTKAAKDLAQAAALLSYVSSTEEGCERIRWMWRELLARGPGWRKRATIGRGALARAAPDLDVNVLLFDSARAFE